MAVLEGKRIWAPSDGVHSWGRKRRAEEGASPARSVWEAGRPGVPAAGRGEARGPAYFGSCCDSRQKSCWGLSRASSVGQLTASSSSASEATKQRSPYVKAARGLSAGISPCRGAGANHRAFPELPARGDVKWKALARVRVFATPWTIQSVEFSRPEDLSG